MGTDAELWTISLTPGDTVSEQNDLRVSVLPRYSPLCHDTSSVGVVVRAGVAPGMTVPARYAYSLDIVA